MSAAYDTTDYEYCGGVNVEYGGYYAKCDNPEWGYADCVRITDLDSGCGYWVPDIHQRNVQDHNQAPIPNPVSPRCHPGLPARNQQSSVFFRPVGM